jgi:hypothetical protein
VRPGAVGPGRVRADEGAALCGPAPVCVWTLAAAPCEAASGEEVEGAAVARDVVATWRCWTAARICTGALAAPKPGGIVDEPTSGEAPAPSEDSAAPIGESLVAVGSPALSVVSAELAGAGVGAPSPGLARDERGA